MVSPTSSPMSDSLVPLVLCADGGGSKICVVIRGAEGLEVRGVAGPCNVQSVGYAPASQQILLATYRALSQLPSTHLPSALSIPLDNLHEGSTAYPTRSLATSRLVTPLPSRVSSPAPRHARSSSGSSSDETPKELPPLNVAVFRYAWLGLAGITTVLDQQAFMPWVSRVLNMEDERIKITNDVNLLAAPALQLPGIKHVAAVVCGTGTVGRTIEVSAVNTADEEGSGKVRQLPLVDIGVSRGWGWLLCDEGSAFWIGRLAIRSLLFAGDRAASSGLYLAPPRQQLALHRDLLDYFGTDDYMDIINVVSLNDNTFSGVSIGTATARRNALMAGAARIVFRHAFPEEQSSTPALARSPVPTGQMPSPPLSETESSSSNGDSCNKSSDEGSHAEGLKIARSAIRSLIDLTLDLLGDRTVVKPETTALSLGGGLWQCAGYRDLLLSGLKKEGVEFNRFMVVSDAAGVGAKGVAQVEFGL